LETSLEAEDGEAPDYEPPKSLLFNIHEGWDLLEERYREALENPEIETIQPSNIKGTAKLDIMTEMQKILNHSQEAHSPSPAAGILPTPVPAE